MTTFFSVFDNLSNYELTTVRKQVWKTKKFSYKDTPRPDYGLMFLHRGRVDFVCNGATLSANAGDLIFLPKDCRYEVFFYTEKEEVADYLVNFSATSVKTVDAPVRLLQKLSTSFMKTFEKISKLEFENKSIFFRNGNLYFLLDELFTFVKCENRRPTDEILDTAISLLCGDEDLSIKEIAKACNVSESGFRKMFTDEYGVSPTQYRRLNRIKKAKYLLESTDLSVKEIAYELHYYDESYFCRTFLKLVGKTPKEYLKDRKL